ncbi:MAG: trigger factor [Acidobacteriota bacterium]|nr:MAG: trigger factor [Acidobacteriota bacterium]
MNTELIDRSETNKEIRIEIAPEEVRKVYDAVSKKYAGKVQVPGFRKGLAPLDVIRMRFADDIKNDVIQQLLPERVTSAIEEHGLRPLSEPHIHLEDHENLKVNGSQTLVVGVHVEVMPEIPDPAYEGLEATRRVRQIADDEVDSIIDERRQQQSTFLPADDRQSEDGDMVIVDLKGTFADDPEADPIEVSDLEVQLGDDLIEKSFTENLVGVKAGDEKEFKVDYPEEFSSPALAGRTVEYKASVKSVGKVELPELDDEWVASLDEEAKTVKDLKKRLRDQMETLAEGDADARVRSDLIAKLIEKHEFEVPNALIESQARNLLDNFARDLAEKGVDLSKVDQQFVEMTYHQMRGQAERDVRGAILLEKVADLEKVEVSEEDVNAEIETMAAYYQVPVEQIRASIAQQGGPSVIENNLRTRKAVEAMVGKAKISEGEWVDERHPASAEAADEKPKKKAKAPAKKQKPAAKAKPGKKPEKKN